MVNQVRKLHLGCGLNTPNGWINLDGSWNASLSKYPAIKNILQSLRIISSEKANIPWSPDILIHDVRKRLPFKDNYFCAIYASHLLEHLYLEEAKLLLNECVRILKPNGILRMVVPDLKAIIFEYIQSDGRLHDQDQGNRADNFNIRLLMRSPQPPSGNIFLRIFNSLNDFHSHKWMYDADSLIRLFEYAGFSNVKEMQLNDSRIKGIEKIEIPERILNENGICVEGFRP